MQKKLVTLAGTLCLTFHAAIMMAQPTLTLTGYTYTTDQLVVGTVKSDVAVSRYVLRGADAGSFNLDKANQLSIRPAAARSEKAWYDVIVEGQHAGGMLRDTFRLVKDQFIRSPVIAHRGAWKQSGTTENSLASLNNAIRLGCMGSEFDVHMSADSVLFIHHDPDVDGVSIEQTPASQLRTLRLSNGEPLPTLEAYLREGIKQNRTRLILEIKTSKLGRSMALTERVVAMVRRLKAQAWVDYIAFSYEVCQKVRELDPVATVAYLNGDKTPEQLAADHLSGFDYHFSVLRKNESWIQEAHQRKLTTNVWTVNDRSALQAFLNQGIDYITTNEPELLLTLIRKK